MIPVWLLWLLASPLITGASCQAWTDDETGARYLETAVVIEGAPADSSLYRLTIMVHSTRTAVGARILYSDTLRGGGHVTPSHPMPTVERRRLLMGARVDPENGPPDEVWATCVLEGGG